MTTAEIIEEIKRLPKSEQMKVAEFSRQQPENRALSPEELGDLAEQMVAAKDVAEADRFQAEIVRGFSGGESNAQKRVRKCGADILSAGSGGILSPETRGEDAP